MIGHPWRAAMRNNIALTTASAARDEPEPRGSGLTGRILLGGGLIILGYIMGSLHAWQVAVEACAR